MGTERVFVNSKNQPEEIEIDDSIRQAEYKYTYSDSSQTALKSEQADMLVSAVEKFSQQIPLNLEEIFVWYFEQKGVDNPERFLVQQNQEINPLMLQFLMNGLSNKTQEPQETEGQKEVIKEIPEKENNEKDFANLLNNLVGEGEKNEV